MHKRNEKHLHSYESLVCILDIWWFKNLRWIQKTSGSKTVKMFLNHHKSVVPELFWLKICFYIRSSPKISSVFSLNKLWVVCGAMMKHLNHWTLRICYGIEAQTNRQNIGHNNGDGKKRNSNKNICILYGLLVAAVRTAYSMRRCDSVFRWWIRDDYGHGMKKSELKMLANAWLIISQWYATWMVKCWMDGLFLDGLALYNHIDWRKSQWTTQNSLNLLFCIRIHINGQSKSIHGPVCCIP